MTEIPTEYRGWWRIVDTSQWVNDGLDILGPAVLSESDDQCLAKVERDEWDFAISMVGGYVVEAAKQVGLEVPRATRALWGRSQEAAIGAYRNCTARKD